MTVVLTATEIVAKLDSFDPKRGAVWLGTGMSQGYPSWWSLVESLCTACNVSFSNAFDAAQLIKAAAECQQNDLATYNHILTTTFKSLPNNSDLRYYALFDIGFHAYVTTNYDQLLEHYAPKVKPPNKFSYPDLPAIELHKKASPSIFHLHGSILRPHGLNPSHSSDFFVLSETDFEQAYGAESLLPSFLAQLFRNFSVLFVGCSLEEPELQRILSAMEAIFLTLKKFDNRIKNPPKYFLSARKQKRNSSGATMGFDEVAEQGEVDRLSPFNIEVLRYESHPVLTEVLEQLKRRQSPKPALTPT